MPKCLFQAVLVIRPNFRSKSLHPRRLRNTCNPAADVFLAVSWTALVIENCSRLMMLRNTWVEFKFRSIHIAMSWEIPLNLLRSFADWTWTRLPCVHFLSNSMCQRPVCCSSMMFAMFLARATRRGSFALSDVSHANCNHTESRWDLGPMIWRIQKRRRRKRRRLLKSAPVVREEACQCRRKTYSAMERILHIECCLALRYRTNEQLRPTKKSCEPVHGWKEQKTTTWSRFFGSPVDATQGPKCLGP